MRVSSLSKREGGAPRSSSSESNLFEEGESEERRKRSVARGSELDVVFGSPARAPEESTRRRPVLNRGLSARRARGFLLRARRVTRLSATMTRELYSLSWPIAAAMLGETAMGLVDTKLVSGLGAAALGGVGLATVVMYLAYSIAFGIMRGVKVRVAHAIGEGRSAHGFAYARAGLIIGALFGALVLLACRDVSPLLRWLGASPEIVPYARDFLAAVTLGAPATAAMAALIQHRQAIGDSRTPMVVGIAGNLLNAALAWVLIYGLGPFPALGVRGGGYATATTEVIELAVMLTLLIRDERKIDSDSRRPTFRQALREVAELGVPTGAQFGAEMLAFTAFTVVLGTISKEEIAAHQVALNIIRVSFLPGVAISEATSVLVGRALGRRRLTEADTAVRSGLALAIIFMTICGVFFAIGGGALGHLFSTNTIVIAKIRNLLLIAALFQVLDAANIVLRGALRGAKDVRWVAILGVLVVWTFIPTSAYVFGKQLGLGAFGGWLGFVGETTFGSLLFWLRYKRGGWRRDYNN